MLEEIGAPYRSEVLGYPAMKAPGYLAINPMGKVPAIRHGEVVVTEAAAICAYLADAFPQAGLAPPVAARAAYYRWLFFVAGPLEAAMTNQALGYEVPPERRAMAGYGSFDDVLRTLEDALKGSPYIAGDAFTAADVYVGSGLAFGMMFKAIAPRPAFEAYLGKLVRRPAAIRAREIDDALIAASPAA